MKHETLCSTLELHPSAKYQMTQVLTQTNKASHLVHSRESKLLELPAATATTTGTTAPRPVSIVVSTDIAQWILPRAAPAGQPGWIVSHARLVPGRALDAVLSLPLVCGE
jgi:hypothetical protein